MSSSGFQSVVGMALIMGAASYVVGLAPLSMPLSKKHLSMLSNFGTGLLIGTALGVILPEGIEELVASAQDQSSHSFSIGFPILLGFAFMFLVEEYVSPHAQPLYSSPSQPGEPIFAIDLEEPEHQEPEGLPNRTHPENPSQTQLKASGTQRAYSLTLGLIIHALVDGYALGVSASRTHSPHLSFVVFIAIIIHKAPTALALTASLLASSLPVTNCKKHLLYFSIATPVSSILSYALYAIPSESATRWSGSPLLFSGGTFLYVAAVLQPGSGHAGESLSEVSKSVRSVLLVGGIFLPVLLSRLVVHAH